MVLSDHKQTMSLGFLGVIFSVLLSPRVFADSGVTYHGRLLKPNGEPVTSSSVQFRIQIRTPSDSDCLMFEEIQTKDLSDSNGLFTVSIGDGSATVVNTEPFGISEVFQNKKTVTFPGGKCVTSHTAVLGPTASRQLKVSFNDGTFAGWEPLPPQAINFVPTAMESVSVGGHEPDHLFRVHDGAGVPQIMSPWSPVSYQKLLDLVTNTTISGGVASIGGNAAGFTGSLAGDVTGTQSLTKVEKIQGNAVLAGIPSDKQVLTWNHTQLRWEPANVPVAGNPDWNDIVNKPVGTANGQVLQYDTSLGWKADKLLYTDLVKAGGGSPWPSTPCVAGEAIIWQSATDGFECAPISITETDPTVKGFAKNDPSSDFSTTGNVLTLNTVPITRGGTGAVSQSGAINNLLPSQGGNSGKLLQTNGTNVSWVDAPASGVTSINGATGASQTFNTAQANTAPTFTRVGDTHTLEIPLASTSGVTSGTISHADYQTFSGKQNALGFTPLNPANNLSELASAATARTNLGLGTAATKNFGTSNGNLVELDGSGKIPSSLLPSQSGTYFAQGGNVFSAPAVLGTTDAQPLHLRTGGTDKMTVLNNGNVGIGTATPIGRLHIVTDSPASTSDDDLRLDTYNTVLGSAPSFSGRRARGTLASPEVVLMDDSLASFQGQGYNGTDFRGVGAFEVHAAGDFTAAAASQIGYLSLKTRSSSGTFERMRIDSNGNVGIGTTTPNDKLDVSGKIRATHICASDGTNCKDLLTSWGSGGTVTSVVAGTGLTGGNITTSGTIGLGTELSGLNALNTTGFIKRTAAGTYSTTSTVNLASEVTGTLPLTSTSGTLAIARGGTGAASQSGAINNLLPSQGGNSGKVLQTDGTDVSWVPAPTTGMTALTGDVTASGTGSVTTTIANNAVTTAKLANNAVDTSKILDGTILGADLNFSGVNGATSSFVLKDGTGKFANFACATTGHVPTWTVTGFACQAPAITETDPKVGANTTNMLSKWNGTALVASGVHESGGNVGIGTTSPSAKLEIGGIAGVDGIRFPDGTLQTTSAVLGINNSMVTGWPDAIRCAYNSSGYWVILNLSQSDPSVTGVWYQWLGNSSSYFVKFNTDGTYLSSSNAYNGTDLNCVGKTISQLYSNGQAFNFAKGPAGLWLQSGSHAYYNAGSVGIGTTTPRSKLDVDGGVTVQTAFEGVAAAVSSGSSYTIADVSKSVVRVNLTANTTVTLPSTSAVPVDTLYVLTVRVKQDATGGRTLSWAGGGKTIRWDGSAAGAPASAAGAVSLYQFSYIGGENEWYAALVYKE